MLKQPLISIVIPIYNTEEFLPACLDSIITQTYKNLQIICVNDASPDNSAKIINEYAQKDERIEVITHDKNRGLFKARLSGADIAKGDYICFVDSDDTISLDWIRLLVDKAQEENADMTLANTVQVKEGVHYIENNYMSLYFDRPTLIGEEIFGTFMQDAGYNFAWHTVWNKLYSKELWNKARPEYEAIQDHLIMAEDIAYTLVLFYFAKRMAFSNHDAYFYCRNDSASTSASTISLQRIKKYISDISNVFNFFENFLKKHNIYQKYEAQFLEFKGRYFRIQCNILQARGLWNNKEYCSLLCDSFGEEKPELTRADDFYFYDIRTNWEGNQKYSEKLKRSIIDPINEIISFDVFDTLILRPFLSPDRFFDFFEHKYRDYLEQNSIYNFKEKRLEAENLYRGQKTLFNPSIEDCVIDDIYSALSTYFSIPIEVCRHLQELELVTELEICRPRKSAIQLLELAKYVGKKVIITSDIYYDKEFMIKLLQKNGIEGYDDIFLSSMCKKLKATGSLFKYIQTIYPNKKILHIGDNWSSDVLVAQKQGLSAMFLSKVGEIFKGIHADNYTGPAMVERNDCVFSFSDVGMMSKQLTLNACQAISANRVFDKPFPSWNEELQYNANAYFIGNYVFGMEMLGLSSWLYKIAKENMYRKIVFLARDGYLPKIAFDSFLKKRNINDIRSEYFYVSRRSLMPIAIDEKQDLSVLQEFIDIKQHSVESIISLLRHYFNDAEKAIDYLKSLEINSKDTFKSIYIFEKAIQTLNRYFDFGSYKKYADGIRFYFKKIFDFQTLCFDLGYSGRIQTLISKAAGHGIDVCFLHSSGIEAVQNARLNGFKIYSYLDYTPKISSVIREYFFSELTASCIGYKIEKEKLIPQFDQSNYSYVEHYIQDEIIRGMTDFICDYCTIFAQYDFMFYFRSEECSLAFETFINDIPLKDMWMFRCCTAEDVLYFNYERRSLYDIWKYNLDNRKCVTKTNLAQTSNNCLPANNGQSMFGTDQYLQLSKFKKAVILFFTDRKLFLHRLKTHLQKKETKAE